MLVSLRVAFVQHFVAVSICVYISLRRKDKRARQSCSPSRKVRLSCAWRPHREDSRRQPPRVATNAPLLSFFPYLAFLCSSTLFRDATPAISRLPSLLRCLFPRSPDTSPARRATSVCRLSPVGYRSSGLEDFRRERSAPACPGYVADASEDRKENSARTAHASAEVLSRAIQRCRAF